tara:strand:- start:1162 stop:2265 length:1104 start_codon:yes stop_codon:yes gene_type:complete
MRGNRMPDFTQYGRPEWHVGFTGFAFSSGLPNRVVPYIKAFKLHLYGGDVGGSWGSESEYIHLYPPDRSEVISEMRGKYGSSRLPSGDLWSGSRYYPRDHDNDTVYGWTSNSPWNYSTSGDAVTWTTAGSSLHWNAYIHDAHSSSVTGDHTGSSRGSFSSSNFTWTAGSGTSSKSAADWENEVRSVETDIAAAVAVNGRYPVYPGTTETFGTYTASTNTYVAGAADALNADDWYTEFTQAVVALEAAIVRIGDLRNDLGDRVINRPEDEEELEPLEGPGPVPEQTHRESEVFVEPLIEFPKIEFSLEGIKEPEPPASDDVEVPGLLRVANFAKRTDSVSAFSRHTYSESSFSPRETVSPAFNKDEEE